MTEQTRSAANGAAVTPSDSTLLSGVRALYIGGAGDVSVNFPGSPTAVVFVGVPAGTVLPVQAMRVRATGTTATSIVALF
jgi:hypothetical protein